MSTPVMYRKKPVVIEAMRFDGTADEMLAVYRWVEANTIGSFDPLACIEGREPWPASGVAIDPRDGRMIIATLEGAHWVDIGDYVIRGVQGEFYPCKPDIFRATYEVVQPMKHASRQPRRVGLIVGALTGAVIGVILGITLVPLGIVALVIGGAK